MAHKSDADLIAHDQNTARFFVENRQISWVLLVGTILWGVYGYWKMPQRKDPEIPVRVAVAICPWPGVIAEKVEQLLTRPIEQRIAESSAIHPPSAADFGIRSLSLPGVSIVTIQLSESVKDTKKEFNDINLKLNALNENLPDGAGPIVFNSDFGDTSALMLTVASPRVSDLEIAVRAEGIRKGIEAARAAAGSRKDPRVAIVVSMPLSVSAPTVRRPLENFVRYVSERAPFTDARIIEGPGYAGVDAATPLGDAQVQQFGDMFVRERMLASEFHPDGWPPVVIRDPAESAVALAKVAGDKYSYRELDEFTDLISRSLQTVTQVSKVSRSGVLPQQVLLEYSQERLASYGLRPSTLPQWLSARNITLAGGVIEAGGKNLTIDPSGEFHSEREIGEVLIPVQDALPLYLRDVVSIERGYQSPPRFLNFYTSRDSAGAWRRSRAVTLAVQMRSGEQINIFGQSVDAKLNEVRQLLPDDLIVARTSDQPRQVEENVHLFNRALEEAVVLVVIISLIGFWEWRSAVLMALAIPITLAMTYGMMHLLGVDLQQVSIASLIIALGLLVDDPVVAGDAIKRDLAAGHPRVVAAWLGPTKLATAILFATITNIVAYLPFLMLSGNTGDFLYTLPIVMTCSLVASRIVSMTFIPLLGYYLLRPKAETPIAERRNTGFAGFYYRIGRWAIAHRWKVLVGSFGLIALGGFFGSQLKSEFFPKDRQYLFYVDLWLPNDATFTATNETAIRAERIIQDVAAEYSRKHRGEDGNPREVLRSVTTFVGGGGPRFWFSVSPELQQINYAQLILEVGDKEDTTALIGPMQTALSGALAGVRADVQELQTNPVQFPVEIILSGRADVSYDQSAEQIRTLQEIARQVKEILYATPGASRTRSDWGEDSFVVKLEVDADRANLVGITNLDVAASSASAISGFSVTTLREGDKQIPVVARLRMEERARLADVQSMYVYSSISTQKVPLIDISSIRYNMQTEKIRRRDHFRAVTVQSYPMQGVLASEVMAQVLPKLREFEKSLPPGYTMEIGGEQAKQETGFLDLTIVMAISVAMIFLALVIQFRHAVKPFLVFAAIPYGVVGALAALWLMGTPFGFMAFLGVASLVGVIVSHVIVLFDFIEERHAEGEELEIALLDAGILRLRPVLITVGATVIALFPLAKNGGPLWQPLCFAQIGGLTIATFITLLLVPVLYAIFVRDLKLVEWETHPRHEAK